MRLSLVLGLFLAVSGPLPGSAASEQAQQAPAHHSRTGVVHARPTARPLGEVCTECRPAVRRRVFISLPDAASTLPNGVAWQSLGDALASKLRGAAWVAEVEPPGQQPTDPRSTDLELCLALAVTAGATSTSAAPPQRGDGTAATNRAEAERLEAQAADLDRQAADVQVGAASRMVSADDAGCGLITCWPTTDRYGNVNQAAYNECLERQNRCVEAASARASSENERIRSETESQANGLRSRAQGLRADAERLRNGGVATQASAAPAYVRPVAVTYDLRWSLREPRPGSQVLAGSVPANDVAGSGAKPRETLFEPTKPPAGWVPPEVEHLAGLVAEAIAIEATTLPLVIRVASVGQVVRADVGALAGVRVGDLFRLGRADRPADGARSDKSEPARAAFRVVTSDATSCSLEVIGPHPKLTQGDQLEWIGLEKPRE